MPTIDLVVKVPAGMAVAEALHLLRQAAPHGPWPWPLRQRAEGLHQVRCGDFLAGQGEDALGAGAMEGIVEVGHGLAQLLTLGGGGGQGVLVAGLVGSDLTEMALRSLHRRVGTLEAGSGLVVASKGVVSGGFVDATPPALAGQRNRVLGLFQLAGRIAAVLLGAVQLGPGASHPVTDVGGQAGS